MDKRERIHELFAKYGGVIFDKCLRLLGDRAAAQDAVQDTFVAAYVHLDSFRYGANYRAWLYRIATNACISLLRTRRRRPESGPDVIETLAGSGAGAPGQLEARRTLEQLLPSLDARNLEILVAHFIDGMDQGQIAEVLGVSRRAVVKRLTKLRHEWEKAGGGHE